MVQFGDLCERSLTVINDITVRNNSRPKKNHDEWYETLAKSRSRHVHIHVIKAKSQLYYFKPRFIHPQKGLFYPQKRFLRHSKVGMIKRSFLGDKKIYSGSEFIFSGVDIIFFGRGIFSEEKRKDFKFKK